MSADKWVTYNDKPVKKNGKQVVRANPRYDTYIRFKFGNTQYVPSGLIGTWTQVSSGLWDCRITFEEYVEWLLNPDRVKSGMFQDAFEDPVSNPVTIVEGSIDAMGAACYLFYSCSGLVEVENLKIVAWGIGETTSPEFVSTFESCTSLRSATLTLDTSKKLHCIVRTFANCTNLEKVIFTEGSTVYAEASYNCGCVEIFLNCINLKTVKMPSIKAIESENGGTVYGMGTSNMFKNCRSLEYTPTMDWDALYSAYSMFEGCTGLVGASIGSPGRSLRLGSIFKGCTSLKNCSFNGAIIYGSYILSGSWYVYSIGSIFEDCASLEELPEMNIASNADYCVAAFKNCRKVKSGITQVYQAILNNGHSWRQYEVRECFRNCGVDTASGSAELAEIPESWK